MPSSAVIDRSARDQLAEAMERFLSEEISSWELLDHIEKTPWQDSAVSFAANSLYLPLVNSEDHKAQLSKAEWNFYQRLLLILRSNAIVEISRTRIWSRRQLLAAATLVAFIAITIEIGWNSWLFLLLIPMGCVSLIIAKTKKPIPFPAELQLTYPFASQGEIIAVRRGTPGFKKRRCLAPKLRKERMSRQVTRVLLFPVAWFLLSPFPLFYQMLPDQVETTWVRL